MYVAVAVVAVVISSRELLCVGPFVECLLLLLIIIVWVYVLAKQKFCLGRTFFFLERARLCCATYLCTRIFVHRHSHFALPSADITHQNNVIMTPASELLHYDSRRLQIVLC